MNFLEKLDYLMLQNGLNKSTLSKACQIPYTTIDGWYKKGYEGLKLTTLRKLADYFKTTLDFWANDDILNFEPLHKQGKKNQATDALKQIKELLGDNTYQAVNMFIRLDATDQGAALERMRIMLESEKYLKQRESKQA